MKRYLSEDSIDFMNTLYGSDLKSFLIVLENYARVKYNENINEDAQIESMGFNINTGFVFLLLDNGITIASAFGQDVVFFVFDEGEELAYMEYEEAKNHEYKDYN